mmetsp:Transcript_26010/g.57813  ORF Transcript_26010/g.57813 Transcript_26010/m.57813 type:complete len:452 (+) Transcript_26010:163-1518(+)
MAPSSPDRHKRYSRLDSSPDEFPDHKVSFGAEVRDAEQGIADPQEDLVGTKEDAPAYRPGPIRCALALILCSVAVLGTLKGIAIHCSRRHDSDSSSGTANAIKAETPVHVAINASRAYDVWDKPFPCYPFDRSYYEGMFYAKVPKTASSTLSGIGLRIAHRKGRELNIADQQQQPPPQKSKKKKKHSHSKHDALCNVEVKHGDVADEFHYGLRNRERSFLWSFVRDPTQHALSHYYYTYISRSGHKIKEDSFKTWLLDYPGDFQMKYLQLHKEYKTADDAVLGIMDGYNFIGITERLDESLVVLQMILGLDVGDILYLSAKQSGGYALVSNNSTRRCIATEHKRMEPFMDEFFESSEWTSHVQDDAKLYDIVNRSLDLTIEKLGRSEFESKLQAFQDALSLVQERCTERTVFPCSPDGEYIGKNDCYKLDMGCGYPCLDEVASELSISVKE